MNSAQPMTYREWAVLLVASLAMFLNTVDISILNVAMPVIERELAVDMRLLQWLQGAYGLPYAGFLLLSGRLADLIGRRRVFLTGVALFGAASLAGSIAPSFAILLAARAIQGIGAALMVPSAISIISTTFEEGPRRNRALGIFSAVAATGFSSGLVSGALITELASWRWVFFVNVPITAAILGVAPFAVHPSGGRQRSSIDILGAGLVTAGTLGACLHDHDTRRRRTRDTSARVAGGGHWSPHSVCLSREPSPEPAHSLVPIRFAHSQDGRCRRVRPTGFSLRVLFPCVHVPAVCGGVQLARGRFVTRRGVSTQIGAIRH